jgi:VWFA-related protein
VILLAAAPMAVSESRPVAPLVVRLSVDIVQIDVVVTDKKGRPVTDLTAADFEVLQDGKRQVVSQISYVGPGRAASSPAPISAAAPIPAADPEAQATPGAPTDAIVFVVDDHALSLPSVAATTRALLQFADEMGAEDEVFLLRSSRRYVDLRPVEGPAELRAAARGLRHLPVAGANDPVEAAGGFARMPLAPPLLATNAYFNRLLARQSLLSLQNVVEALRAWKGRKTLVLFSEGYPIWDLRGRDASPFDPVYGRGGEVLDEVERLTDLANRASVVIHTLDPRGLIPVGISASDSNPHPTHEGFLGAMAARRAAVNTSQASLAYLAERTGGLAVANRNDVGEGVSRILSGSRAYYLVGYEPDRSTFGGERPRFHSLEVRVKRPGLKVRSRKGFFGVSDDELLTLAPPGALPDPPR